MGKEPTISPADPCFTVQDVGGRVVVTFTTDALTNPVELEPHRPQALPAGRRHPALGRTGLRPRTGLPESPLLRQPGGRDPSHPQQKARPRPRLHPVRRRPRTHPTPAHHPPGPGAHYRREPGRGGQAGMTFGGCPRTMPWITNRPGLVANGPTLRVTHMSDEKEFPEGAGQRPLHRCRCCETAVECISSAVSSWR